MRKTLVVLAAVALVPAAFAADKPATDRLEEGKKLSFDRKKGNCLACHVIEGGDLPGTAGPALSMKFGNTVVKMKQRYPNRADLRSQIWDATMKNPESMMPPFGRHKILTEEEIDLITDYIWSL